MAGYLYSTDILMVGKTGVGKSALGNIILQKKAFRSKNSTESVTKTADFDFCQIDGRILKVVDGPGLGDTALNPEEAVKLVVDAMSNAICANPNGYHAILLVVRYGGRFTKEDAETVDTLKKIFGEKFITDHAILVLTCGDNFKSDEEELTFEEWCEQQEGIFGKLYTDVRKRAILFDNTTKEKDILYDQIRRLLDMVDALGARYTSKMFEEAKSTRYRLLQGERRLINEDAIREAGLITQLLSRVDTRNPEEGLGQLQDLKERADLLLEDISKQVKGTKSQTVAMKLAQNLNTTITDQLEQMQRDYDKIEVEKSEQGERPEPDIMAEDMGQNARMSERAKMRQTQTENLKQTEEQRNILRRVEERMAREAEESKRQRAENKERCEEERRAEERARKISQINKKKCPQEKEDLSEEYQRALADFEQLEKENAQRACYKIQPHEFEEDEGPESQSLTEDESQAHDKITEACERPGDESKEILMEDLSKSAKLRQTEIENFKATTEHLKMLQLKKERMMREDQEAEERKRQRAENKKRREEEKRAEEKARKKDQMDKKKRQQLRHKLTEQNRKSLEEFRQSMAQLAVERDKDLQEKLATLEHDYQIMKGETLSAWIMEGAPSIFSKILSGFGLAGRSKKK